MIYLFYVFCKIATFYFYFITPWQRFHVLVPEVGTFIIKMESLILTWYLRDIG